MLMPAYATPNMDEAKRSIRKVKAFQPELSILFKIFSFFSGMLPLLTLVHTKGSNTFTNEKARSSMNNSKRLSQMRFLRLGIIVLTALTAVVHLVLAFGTFWVRFQGPAPAHSSPEGLLMIAVLFLLNCVGYLVLVIALYMRRLQRFQRLTRWLLIGYTALTMVLGYLIVSSPDLFFESVNLIEALLIALLLIDGWQNRQAHLRTA